MAAGVIVLVCELPFNLCFVPKQYNFERFTAVLSLADVFFFFFYESAPIKIAIRLRSIRKVPCDITYKLYTYTTKDFLYVDTIIIAWYLDTAPFDVRVHLFVERPTILRIEFELQR